MGLDRDAILELLAGQTFAAVASTAERDAQVAVVGIVADGSEIFFDTLGTSRKAVNLRRHPRAAAVVWQGAWTIQLEGDVDEPRDAELDAWLARYLARFPDGRERQAWPDICYFRVRATWLRYSDFAGPTPEIVQLLPR